MSAKSANQTLLPWISSAAGSHARTQAQQARALALAAIEAAFGLSSGVWSQSSGLRGWLSKTWRAGRADGWTLSESHWKSSTMSRFRSRFRRRIAALGTREHGFSLLPTLVATRGGHNQGGAAGREGPIRPSLDTLAKSGALLPTLTVCGNYNRKGASKNSGDGLRTALLPTMTASETQRGSQQAYPRGNLTLTGALQEKLLPTMTASAADRGKAMRGKNAQGGASLHEALLPTLCARDEKGPGPAHTQGGADLPSTLGGHLNPDWCLWFQGFPAAWLDVDDAPAFVRSAKSSSRTKPK